MVFVSISLDEKTLIMILENMGFEINRTWYPTLDQAIFMTKDNKGIRVRSILVDIDVLDEEKLKEIERQNPY